MYLNNLKSLKFWLRRKHKIHQYPLIKSRGRIHIWCINQVLQILWNCTTIYDPAYPKLNGATERNDRTIVECAWSMLKVKNLTNGFWDEVIFTVVYLKKRCPTKILDHKTPFDALYSYKPTLSHLRIFGSKAFSHVPKEDRRKLDAKAIKCIFIGYCSDHKAYKLFDHCTHKVFTSRDALFNEHANEGHKVDNYDAWNIPYDHDENVKEEAEQEQEQK